MLKNESKGGITNNKNEILTTKPVLMIWYQISFIVMAKKRIII